MNAPSLEEFLKVAPQSNPGVPEETLKSYWEETYGGPARPSAASLPSLEKFLPAAKEKNPQVPEEDLKNYWQEEYGSKGASVKEERVSATDYAKSLAGGALSGAGMIAQGGGELLARGVNAVAGTELRAINPLQGAIDWLSESQTKAAKQAQADTNITGNLFDPSTWSAGTNPSLHGLALQGVNAIGQFAPNLALALTTAGASIPVQLATGAIVGGVQALGGSLDQEREDIGKMDHETLLASSTLYKELIDKGVKQDVAKNAVAEAAALGGGIGNAIPSAAEGAFENFLVGALTRGRVKIPSLGAGIAGKVATGIVGGAVTGGTEEAVEQMGQNIGSNIAIGGNRPITHDTLQQFVMGAIAEGAAGGGAGVLQHVAQPAPAPAKADPVQEILKADSASEAITAALQPLHDTLALEAFQGGALAPDVAEGIVGRATTAAQVETARQQKASQDERVREAQIAVSEAQRAKQVSGLPEALFVLSDNDVAELGQRLQQIYADQLTPAQEQAAGGTGPLAEQLTNARRIGESQSDYDARLRGEVPNAVQKPSATRVDVRQQARDGEAVAGGYPQGDQAAGAQVVAQGDRQPGGRQETVAPAGEAAASAAQRAAEVSQGQPQAVPATGVPAQPGAAAQQGNVPRGTSESRIFGKQVGDLTDAELKLAATSHRMTAHREVAQTEIARREALKVEESPAVEQEKTTYTPEEGAKELGATLATKEETPVTARLSARVVEKAFGKKVVFVKGGESEGAIFPSDPSKVYVNVNATRKWQALIGHETTHALKRTNAKVYDELESAVNSAITDKAFTWAEKKYGERTKDIQNEEIVANVVGDQMHEPKFWLEVFKRTGDVNALFKAVTSTLDRMYTKITGAERLGYNTKEFITDQKAVRSAVAKAYAAWQKGGREKVATGESVNGTENTNVLESKAADRGGSDQVAGKSAATPIVTARQAVAHSKENPPAKSRLGFCHKLTWRKVFDNPSYRQIIGVVNGWPDKARPKGDFKISIWHSVAYDPKTGNIWEPISDRWYTQAAMKSFGFEPVASLTNDEAGPLALKTGKYPDQQIYSDNVETLRGAESDFLQPGDYDPDWKLVKGKSEGALHSKPDSTWYYSALAKEIAAKNPGNASPEAWKKYVSGLTQRGVKKDEIEWSGLPEWIGTLAESEGVKKVSPQEVLDYLKTNGTNVVDVIKRSHPLKKSSLEEEDSPEIARFNLSIDTLEGRGYRVNFDPLSGELDSVYHVADDKMYYGQDVNGEEGLGLGDLPGADATLALRIEQLAQSIPVEESGNDTFNRPDLMLPGGKNPVTILVRLADPESSDVYNEAFRKAEEFEDELAKKYGDGFTSHDLTDEEDSKLDELRHRERIEKEKSKRADGFVGGHYPEEGVIVHIRAAEHADVDHGRVFLANEIQSDWGQKGKKEGFAGNNLLTPDDLTATKTADEKFDADGKRDRPALWNVRRADGSNMGTWGADTAEEAKIRAISNAAYYSNARTGVPKAPFVGKTESWVALALKRIISYAVENGFDKVAWTTGEQQTQRYTEALRKHVDRIEWTKTKDGVQLVGFKGVGDELTKSDRKRLALLNVRRQDTLNDAEVNELLDLRARERGQPEKVVDTTEKETVLSDAIGKTMADKIIKDSSQSGVIEGNDIAISKTGMANFYDKIVPNVANDVLKKLGGERVGKVNIGKADERGIDWSLKQKQRSTDGEWTAFVANQNGEERKVFADKETAMEWVNERIGLKEQPGFTITPEMKKRAAAGLPLFSKADEVKTKGTRDDTWARGMISELGAKATVKKRNVRIEWVHTRRGETWTSVTEDGRYSIEPHNEGKKGFYSLVNGKQIGWDESRTDAIHRLTDHYEEEIAEGKVQDPSEAKSALKEYKPDQVARLVAGARQLGKEPRLSLLKKSNAKKMEQVFNDVSTKKVVAQVVPEGGSEDSIRHQIAFKDGSVAFIYEEAEKTAYADTSDFDRGSRMGSYFYPAAFNWAKNNGVKLMVDPHGGLTNINEFRRTEQMYSAAVKFGSTEFMSPKDYRGRMWQRLYGWNDNPKTTEDHDKNIALLAAVSMNNTINGDGHKFQGLAKPQGTKPFETAHVSKIDTEAGEKYVVYDERGTVTSEFFDKEKDAKNWLADQKKGIGGIEGWKYNFFKKQFETDSGKRLGLQDIKLVASRWDARKVGIGPTTISRAIFNKSLLEGSPGSKQFIEGKISPSTLLQEVPEEQTLALYSKPDDRAVTQTPEFKKWFGDSKVVDKEGKPLVVYHGTDRSFDTFDIKAPRARISFLEGDPQGFYFTKEKSYGYAGSKDGSNEMPVYLRITNPKYLNKESLDHVIVRKAYREKLEEAGHDGIIYDDGKEIVVFEPEQIKSAIGNRGTFDARSPNILESKPDYIGTDPVANAAARKAGLYRPEKPMKQRVKEMMPGFAVRMKQGFVDQFAPIKELDFKSYMLARMSKGTDGALEAMFLYGKPFLEDGALNAEMKDGGLTKVLQRLQGEHDRFIAWIAGNRAAQLKTEGRERLFEDEEIDWLKNLNQGKMKDGKSRAALYAEVHKEFNAYSKSVLDIAEKQGLIDPESRAVWEKDFYVPFYRNMETEVSGPTVKSGLVSQQAFKKLKGGKEELNDLLANTLQNWSHLLSSAMKNKAALTTMEASVAAGGAIEVPSEHYGKQMQIGKVLKALDGGTERYFVIEDPLLVDAISSMESMNFGFIGKLFGTMKRWLTVGVTANPAFKIRNLIRDSLSSIAVSDLSYNPLANVAGAWADTAHETQARASLLASGGMIRFGTQLEGSRAEYTRDLINAGVPADSILDKEHKVVSMLKLLWEHYQEYGDRGENVNRAALYKQMRAEGKTHLEAAYASRDLLDFSMQGSFRAVRFLVQTVPFFNARLQGLYKIGKAGVENPRRMGAVLGAVGLASIALLLAYKDDDDWKKREEWDRDNFWWFKIGDKAFRIPKPFEVGAVGSFAERMVEYGVSKEMTGKRLATRLGAIVLDNLSMNPTPQIVKPLIELYANKDFFKSQPIETEAMKNLSPQERVGRSTSATAQALGKQNIISPVQIDHLIRSYFGWLGTSATTVLDYGLRPTMGLPERPASTLKDAFLVGNFAENLPTNSSRYITDFYDSSQKITQAYSDWRHAINTHQPERAKEIFEANKEDIQLHGPQSSANRQLMAYNKLEKIIEADKKMTPEEKRTRLNRLDELKGAAAKRYSDLVLRRRSGEGASTQ